MDGLLGYGKIHWQLNLELSINAVVLTRFPVQIPIPLFKRKCFQHPLTGGILNSPVHPDQFYRLPAYGKRLEVLPVRAFAVNTYFRRVRGRSNDRRDETNPGPYRTYQ
jgi:hypothetical protein